MFWRSAPHTDLPEKHFKCLVPDPSLPPIPAALSHFKFDMHADAAMGNEYFQMRSTTGYDGMLSGAAIAYRSKTQPVTAQNVTEAETVSANAAGKVAKYTRSVMSELGYPQEGPTPIYEDNESTVKIVKHDRPTPRSRHIDIRYFGLQHWQ